MLAELIGVALLPFALYPRRYDDEGPPEESAAQARYKGRRNLLHAASVGCFSNSARCSLDWSLPGRRQSAVICDTWRGMPQRWRVFVWWFADLITPLPGSCQCRFFRPYGMVRKIDIAFGSARRSGMSRRQFRLKPRHRTDARLKLSSDLPNALAGGEPRP